MAFLNKLTVVFVLGVSAPMDDEELLDGEGDAIDGNDDSLR